MKDNLQSLIDRYAPDLVSGIGLRIRIEPKTDGWFRGTDLEFRGKLGTIVGYSLEEHLVAVKLDDPPGDWKVIDRIRIDYRDLVVVEPEHGR